MELLLVAALLAAMNVTPLPMPPSWVVVVLLGLKLDVDPVALVLAASIGASLGRVGLAAWTRALGPRLLTRGAAENLDYLAERLDGRRGSWGVALVLAVSPPPSGALYTAAGLLRVPLALVGGACFAGRLVTYGAGVALATTAASALEGRLRGWVGPWPILLGLAALAVSLWLLTALDWRATIETRRPRLRRAAAGRRSAPRPPAASAPPGRPPR